MLVKSMKEINAWFVNSTFLDDEAPAIRPYLEAAEQMHLIPILGTPLYKFVQNEYDKVESTDKDFAELFRFVQPVVILFGMYGAIPALNITTNKTGGFTVGTNDLTTVASRDRVEKLIESTYSQANDAIEQLLLYLEQNSKKFVDPDTKEELWKKSENYWQKTGCLIFTATEFNNIVFINNSRLTFNRIYPSIRLMERIKLRPAFGSALIKALITRKMDNNLQPHDEELLDHLQTALALLTISQDSELAKPDSIHGYKPADANIMAESEINEAKSLLRKYPEEYPEYIGNTPGFEATPLFKNDSKRSIFVIGGPLR